MRLLRLAHYPVGRWRNGRGVARAIVEGAGWHLRLADIEQTGPFSDYPGTRRWFALTSGTCRLGWTDGRAVDCGPATAATLFEGSPAPECTLTGPGAARACNLFLTEANLQGRLDRVALGTAQRHFSHDDGQIVAILVQSGRAAIESAEVGGTLLAHDSVIELPAQGLWLRAADAELQGQGVQGPLAREPVASVLVARVFVPDH